MVRSPRLYWALPETSFFLMTAMLLSRSGLSTSPDHAARTWSKLLSFAVTILSVVFGEADALHAHRTVLLILSKPGILVLEQLKRVCYYAKGFTSGPWTRYSPRDRCIGLLHRRRRARCFFWLSFSHALHRVCLSRRVPELSIQISDSRFLPRHS